MHCQMCTSVLSVRRVHLSSWGSSKICTSGSIRNSQRKLTNRQNKDWVESNTGKRLKISGIIYRKMQISPVIISWLYFSCLHIQGIFFLISYALKMYFEILASMVYRSVVLKDNSLWTVDIIFIKNFKLLGEHIFIF